MKNRISTCRMLLVASLVPAGLAADASAQDLYRSHADMLNAMAANKQAEATMVNALGNFGKSAAEAAKTNEEAREKAAHNDLLETETYYKKRAQHQAFRVAQRAKPGTPDPNAEQASKPAPIELTTFQVDQKSGQFRWPTLLKSNAYDSLRRQIDGLLGKRTPQDSGAGSQNCSETLKVVNALTTRLRDNIRRYSSSDYLAARNFLRTLALEVQQPIDLADPRTLDRVAGR
ncbi:MAG: hypothetical protein AB7O59_20480 [Pirellulales bacterium]